MKEVPEKIIDLVKSHPSLSEEQKNKMIRDCRSWWQGSDKASCASGDAGDKEFDIFHELDQFIAEHPTWASTVHQISTRLSEMGL